MSEEQFFLSKVAQKSGKLFGYFCKRIGSQDIPKKPNLDTLLTAHHSILFVNTKPLSIDSTSVWSKYLIDPVSPWKIIILSWNPSLLSPSEIFTKMFRLICLLLLVTVIGVSTELLICTFKLSLQEGSVIRWLDCFLRFGHFLLWKFAYYL